jgi:hypothetical protein
MELMTASLLFLRTYNYEKLNFVHNEGDWYIFSGYILFNICLIAVSSYDGAIKKRVLYILFHLAALAAYLTYLFAFKNVIFLIFAVVFILAKVTTAFLIDKEIPKSRVFITKAELRKRSETDFKKYVSSNLFSCLCYISPMFLSFILMNITENTARITTISVFLPLALILFYIKYGKNKKLYAEWTIKRFLFEAAFITAGIALYLLQQIFLEVEIKDFSMYILLLTWFATVASCFDRPIFVKKLELLSKQ